MTNEEVINVLNTIYENPTASEQIKEACIVAMEAVDIKNSVERITTGLEISSEEKEEIEGLKGTMTNAEAIKIIKGIDFYTIEDKVAFDLAIKALEREKVCKNTEKCEKLRDIQFGCSACECYVWYVLENGEFNYCPNCGRRVEK